MQQFTTRLLTVIEKEIKLNKIELALVRTTTINTEVRFLESFFEKYTDDLCNLRQMFMDSIVLVRLSACFQHTFQLDYLFQVRWRTLVRNHLTCELRHSYGEVVTTGCWKSPQSQLHNHASVSHLNVCE